MIDGVGLGYQLEDDIGVIAGEVQKAVQNAATIAPHEGIRRLTGSDMVGFLRVDLQRFELLDEVPVETDGSVVVEVAHRTVAAVEAAPLSSSPLSA